MKTILIVEDEKLIRQGIRTMIQRSGVPVEVIMECNNGEIALEILESQKVDVMFTDIRMPKMNGIELVKNMQKLEYKPITVAISGYADFSYAVEMMRLGVREYILKPVEREKLVSIVKQLEEELKAREIVSQNNKQLGKQQLKYLILNEQITQEEMNTLETEYGNDFSLHRFYLCLLQPRKVEQLEKSYIYLHNIEDNDVYLVSEENLDFLLKNEFAGECVGVSSVHCGIREIRKAYEEALYARKKAFCRNCEVVHNEEPDKRIPETLLQDAARHAEMESRLRRVQLLGTDRTDEILYVWKSFFDQVKKGWISYQTFEMCMEDFFGEVRKTYRNILVSDTEILVELSAYYRFTRLDDYEKDFMEWVLELHERINSQFDTSRNKQKIRMAIEYINENYDKDLNMAVVSNHISMNYSLFSYMFKEETGSNFVNYLKNIRMEAAKKLLSETDMRIIEISGQVGYDNEKYFMKTFKTAVGVSPSEYRKNIECQ